MKKLSWTLILPCFLLFENQAYSQWVQTKGPYGREVTSLAVNGGTIFSGTNDDGVFLSTNNGTSWKAVDSGLTNTHVYSLAVNGSRNVFAGTDGGGVFLSTNNGTSWVSSGLGGCGVTSFAISDSTIFLGTYGRGVFLSTDNGTSWKAVNSGLTNTSVFSLAVSGGNIFAGTDSGGIFLSTNNGTSWVSSGLGGNIFAGTDSGGIFLSTNNGTSWNAVNSGLTNSHVYSLAVSGDNIFAGTYYGGVFLSTNNGTSWNAVNSGLKDSIYVHSLAVSGDNIFAGTFYKGVFLSTNNGTSWIPVNSGLKDTIIFSLAVSGGNVFAGTYSGGVWLRPLSEMIKSTNAHPQREISNQVHFEIDPLSREGSIVAIEFTIPYQSQVAVKMYDPAGREISSLVNQRLNAGSYKYFWDTHTFARGCYVARLQAGATTRICQCSL
jgi:hypothetical protein